MRRVVLRGLEVWGLAILGRRHLAQFCGIDVALGIHVIHVVHGITLIVLIWDALAWIHEVVVRIGLLKTLVAELIVLKDGLVILGVGVEVGVGGIGLERALLL